MRCGTPLTDTMVPSAKGTASGNAASRLATHSACVINNATPAPRPARVGNVTTTPPPHGSMRRLTRRARRLRRHSTRVGPQGSASISDRGNSIVARNDRTRRFVNLLDYVCWLTRCSRRLRQLHARCIEGGEQLHLLFAAELEMWRTHVLPCSIAGMTRHQCLERRYCSRCRDDRATCRA